jgi:hypothetical protein
MTPPLTVDDLRANVLKDVKPFTDRPEYAVTDPAFIDPCIAEAIQQGGERDWVVRAAVMKVGNKLRTPEGLARIEKLIAERYQHPIITQDGARVTVDAGVIAGKLHDFRGGLEIDTSPFLDRGEWTTAEVVRFLQLGLAKAPEAAEVDAVVLIPVHGKYPDWRYRYERQKGTVRISQKDWRAPVFVVEGVGPDLGQVKSLHSTGQKVDETKRSPGTVRE